VLLGSGERVLDPKVIVPKGAPSKKRMKPFHETIRESVTMAIFANVLIWGNY
jgi:hypothetical protein